METIWIIGAGKFGLRAAKWLLRKNDNTFAITMVDMNTASLNEAEKLGCRIEVGDGIDFLCRHLTPGHGPDWVVPAVPVHLAWQWCRRQDIQRKIMPLALPEGIKTCLPNPMDGANGDIYVSHADFLCPPNCNEPDDKCTYTGEPRKKDMFRLLSEVQYKDIQPFVIQSEQLGPGVGGYRRSDLLAFRDRIAEYTGTFFAATACRCHGVVSGGYIKKNILIIK